MHQTWLHIALADAYKYACVLVKVPDDVSKAIRKFQEGIAEEDLYNDPDDPHGSGKESDHHITIKYGLHSDDPDEIRELLGDQAGGSIELREVETFKSDDYDVVKVGVDSEDLRRLNKHIAENVEVTDTHPQYKPHMTLAYVLPGKGKNYSGDKSFASMSFDFDAVHLADTDGKKTKIALSE